jgi:trans-aconitate methyltransferase
MANMVSQYSDSRPAWDGPAYADNVGHHRIYDDWFLDGLPLAPADRVLDLGCGSGDFTATVAARVPDGLVVGLDAAPSMLDEARTRARPNQSFVLGPVQRVADLVAGNGPFDVVMSRAMLHWVPWDDHAGVLAAIRGVARPGAAVRIECGGGDNVREIVPFLDSIAARFGRSPRCPWMFAGAGAYLDLVLDAGLSVDGGWCRTVAQRRAFDRETVTGWLISQCVQAYEVDLPADAHEAFRAAVADEVDALRRADGTYDMTFVRLDVLAFT